MIQTHSIKVRINSFKNKNNIDNFSRLENLTPSKNPKNPYIQRAYTPFSSSNVHAA